MIYGIFGVGEKNSKQQQGFTLIELLVILTIMGVIALVSAPLSATIITQNNLENATDELSGFLRTAQQESMAGKNDSAWGVNISPATITLFAGNSFATRNTSLDRIYNIPGNVSITQSSVVFDKLTGNLATPISITLSDTSARSYVISINRLGILDEN